MGIAARGIGRPPVRPEGGGPSVRAMLKRTIPAACAVVASLAAVAPASADSIAYVKNGDVWLATPTRRAGSR